MTTLAPNPPDKAPQETITEGNPAAAYSIPLTTFAAATVATSFHLAANFAVLFSPAINDKD